MMWAVRGSSQTYPTFYQAYMAALADGFSGHAVEESPKQERTPDRPFTDAANQRAYEVIDDIKAGRIAKPVKRELSDTIDKSDAPLTGRPAQDSALHRISKGKPDGKPEPA